MLGRRNLTLCTLGLSAARRADPQLDRPSALGLTCRPLAQLAAYAGVAPLEASAAAALVRHRLDRGGNRRLNAILHRIALSQVRSWPPAQAYLARRLAQGKTRREAIRALKRFLVRALWRLWQVCSPVSPTGYLPAAA